MRRLLLILVLVGLIAVPVVDARTRAVERTPGGVPLSLKYGQGIAKISWRGSLLGRVRRGRIVVTNNVFVGCWRYRTRLTSTTVAYRGRREGCNYMTIHVDSTAGNWLLRVNGRGINISGVARGSLGLNGVDAGPTGRYSIDGEAFRPWPRAARSFPLGP